MEDQKNYINDITEIRRMMERTSKFLSLSGWAGILAGIYALAGAWFSHFILLYQPDGFFYSHPSLDHVIVTAFSVLVFALISAFLDSHVKAKKRNEKAWNATSKRMLMSMAIPLVTGGLLIIILSAGGLVGLAAPLMLIFYGMALYNAGFYTIREVRLMGFVQVILGLMNVVFISHGLLFWAIGFGAVHIIYGLFVHFRYEW
jgi:hypothetical protein